MREDQGCDESLRRSENRVQLKKPKLNVFILSDSSLYSNHAPYFERVNPATNRALLGTEVLLGHCLFSNSGLAPRR